MNIYKFEEIALYTAGGMYPVETHEIKSWMDRACPNYKWLNYNDNGQLPSVLNALNTWWPTKVLGSWPFIVYRYKESDSPHSPLLSDFIEGADNIKAQLPDLIASSTIPWI